LALSPENPFVSFWSEVTTARWVADVGVPLAATLMALGLTYMLVRRQLSHDRDLQRSLRGLAAVTALARALAVESERFYVNAELQLVHASSNSRLDWIAWPSEGLRSLIVDASIVIGRRPLLSQLLGVVDAAEAAWGTCSTTADRLLAEGVNKDAVNHAFLASMYPWK
jgi:hypothetical protein